MIEQMVIPLNIVVASIGLVFSALMVIRPVIVVDLLRFRVSRIAQRIHLQRARQIVGLGVHSMSFMLLSITMCSAAPIQPCSMNMVHVGILGFGGVGLTWIGLAIVIWDHYHRQKG